MSKHADLMSGTIGLDAYSKAVEETDILPKTDIAPVLMGLYGEVGGIMATAKKHIREKGAFPGYRAAAQEEFGDTLWYLAAYCRRKNLSLASIFDSAAKKSHSVILVAASDLPNGAIAHISAPSNAEEIDQALFRLGRAAASLLDMQADLLSTQVLVEEFAACYLVALNTAAFSFAEIARLNIMKTRGAFVPTALDLLPRFDDEFAIEEQIPASFRIRIDQRLSGRSYLRWNEVFIGDPLTDNIDDTDGYRFHDVFHFAHAAILHWSPVVRALMKQKRKSSIRHDEVEDGGRASVVEEGLTAWIFSRAKELNYFEGQKSISFGILKTIQEFTVGYEVSRCPLNLWEQAILQGYAVFRRIKSESGGWVVGDRNARRIHFEPL